MRIILIEVQEVLNMARVSLDGEVVMIGNFHDFKPGTHGIKRYGSFRNYIELSTRIYQYLIRVEKEDFRNIKTIRKSIKTGWNF